MSLRSVLLATAAGHVATGLSLHDTSISYCSWNPLSQLQETSLCEASWIEEPRMIPRSNQTLTSSSPVWQGPHDCMDQYCIYSNQGRSGGRGIVVVTTESNLRRLESLPQILSQDNTGSSFHVDEVPGKGLGLLADRQLERGDAVMQHAPTFLAHRGFVERPPNPEKNLFLEKAVSFLPAPTKEAFLAQLGHFGGHQVTDILITNSFQVNIGGDDGQHFGTYNEVSRFNHACRPNVAFYIDGNLTHRSSVIRPIRPGEELTISYLDPFETHAARQQRTQAAWGFKCGCSQCQQPSTHTSESDRRIQRIRDLESKMENVHGRVTMGMVRRLLELYREERLENKMAGALTLAALRSNLLGMEEEARGYAMQAIEAGMLEGGETGDVAAMRELAADPRGHFTWRKHVKT